MTRMFLAAGVAALAISAPALSKPGEGKGNQGGGQQAQQQPRGNGGGGGGGPKADRGNRGGGGPQAVRMQGGGGGERQQMRAQRGGGGEARQMMRAQRQERAPQQMRVDRQPQRFAKQQQRVRNDNRGRKDLRPQQMRVERAQRQEFRGRDKSIERAVANRGRQVHRIDNRNVLRVNGDVVQARNIDFNRVQARYADNRVLGLINGCPPGLDKKNNGCLPPGQAKKALIGTPLAAALQSSFLPDPLRNYWTDNDDYYYRYNNDGYLYQVNRDTNLIASLLPLFGGGYSLGQAFPYQSSAYMMPSYYQPFYQDTADMYYRYNDGYVYGIDPYSGMVSNIIPTYDYGYGVGQMLPASYSYYNLPYPYRSYYNDNDDYYYRYAPGAIYQVDRDTQLISSIVSLLSGGFGVGQQLPMGYDAYNVPYAYRSQYMDSPDNWYRYNNGYIYQVDPTTRLITAVIDAIV